MAQAEETHYVVLGLLSGASRSEVRQAFRNLALECHPDKVDPKDREAATQRFQRVSEAYAVLSNEEQRATYDRGLELQNRRAKKEQDEEREERERKAAWEARFDEYMTEERPEPPIRRESQRSRRSHGLERDNSQRTPRPDIHRQDSQRSAKLGLGRQQSHRSQRSARSMERDRGRRQNYEYYGRRDRSRSRDDEEHLDRMEAEAYARSSYPRARPQHIPPMPPMPPIPVPMMPRGMPPASPMARNLSHGSSRTMPTMQLHAHTLVHHVYTVYSGSPDCHDRHGVPGYGVGMGHPSHGPPYGYPHSHGYGNGHMHDPYDTAPHPHSPWSEQRLSDLPPTHPFAPSSPIRQVPTTPYGLGPHPHPPCSRWPENAPHFRTPLNDSRTGCTSSPIYAMHARAQSHGSALDDLLNHLENHVDRLEGTGGGLSRAASFARAASAARMGRSRRLSGYGAAVKEGMPMPTPTPPTPTSPSTPPPPRRPSADKAKEQAAQVAARRSSASGLPTPPRSDDHDDNKSPFSTPPSQQSPLLPRASGLFRRTSTRTPDSSLHSRPLSPPITGATGIPAATTVTESFVKKLRPFGRKFSRARSPAEIPLPISPVRSPVSSPPGGPITVTSVAGPVAPAARARSPVRLSPVPRAVHEMPVHAVPSGYPAMAHAPCPQRSPRQFHASPPGFDPRNGFLHHRMHRPRTHYAVL